MSFELRRGTTLAVVGESGSGKSTAANMILQLLEPTAGKIFFDGKDTSTMTRTELFQLRRRLQAVFQNPYGSLDPMYSIFRLIEEPLKIHGYGTLRTPSRRSRAHKRPAANPKKRMTKLARSLRRKAHTNRRRKARTQAEEP